MPFALGDRYIRIITSPSFARPSCYHAFNLAQAIVHSNNLVYLFKQNAQPLYVGI